LLYAVCGYENGYNMGNLKTYTQTLMLFLDWKNGRKIFSNYELKFPHEKIYSFNQLIRLMDEEGKNNISLSIDEMPIYFDSYMRPSKKDGTANFKNFVRQTRKRGVKLYYTSQTFADVNKSLRRVTHKIFMTRKFDILEDGSLLLCERDDCYDDHVLELTEHQVRGEYLIPVSEPIYIPVFPEIFDLYDSEEIIDIQ
jgi:hypothetical protein